jgi:hypothetical protein
MIRWKIKIVYSNLKVVVNRIGTEMGECKCINFPCFQELELHVLGWMRPDFKGFQWLGDWVYVDWLGSMTTELRKVPHAHRQQKMKQSHPTIDSIGNDNGIEHYRHHIVGQNWSLTLGRWHTDILAKELIIFRPSLNELSQRFGNLSEQQRS